MSEWVIFLLRKSVSRITVVTDTHSDIHTPILWSESESDVF